MEEREARFIGEEATQNPWKLFSLATRAAGVSHFIESIAERPTRGTDKRTSGRIGAWWHLDLGISTWISLLLSLHLSLQAFSVEQYWGVVFPSILGNV